ncbi:MAG: Fis family transcriptional regulator [Gammaproteobacteria bacterium]|nr:Fis family transcriptional regulator [Gammaproteobacteria bacterium]
MSQNSPTGVQGVIHEALERYFEHLDGADVTNLYQFFIDEIERPLFQCVMNKCNHNQTRAAEMLGISRNTLRKKLQQYQIEK